MVGFALALIGGGLIGASASLAWSGAGQIAGISGIVGGFLRAPAWRGFRAAFLFGLLLTSVVLGWLSAPALLASSIGVRPLGWLGVAGLLVGLGTQLGSGCTSGHGVCGLSRLSPRSAVATLVFMLVAAVMVLLTRHVLVGAA